MKREPLALSLSLLCLVAWLPWAWSAYSPLLQITKMTGKIQVHSGNGPHYAGQTRPEGDLPYIFPDSKVDILSGQARFESDNHVTIQGEAGSVFAMRVAPIEGNEPRSLLLESLGEGVPIHVYIKDVDLRLGLGGSVAILSDGKGEARVSVESGDVTLARGSALSAGESVSFSLARAGGLLSPGDAVDVKVSPLFAFLSPPVDMMGLVTTSYENPDSKRVVIEQASVAGLPQPAGTQSRSQTRLWSGAERIAQAKEEPSSEFGDMAPLRSAVGSMPSQPIARKSVAPPSARKNIATQHVPKPLAQPSVPEAFTPTSQVFEAQPVIPEEQTEQKESPGLMRRLQWGALAGLMSLLGFIEYRRWGHSGGEGGLGGLDG